MYFYFTIELRRDIPETMKGTFNDWAFGCDILSGRMSEQIF
jgi:hypothetical protein